MFYLQGVVKIGNKKYFFGKRIRVNVVPLYFGEDLKIYGRKS